MAAHTMTVTTVTKAGIVDITADANVEHGNVGSPLYMPNDGRTVFVIVSGTGDTFTFTPTPDKWGRTETLAVVVAGGKTAVIGPFPPSWWNDVSGNVTITPTVGNADDHLLAMKV